MAPQVDCSQKEILALFDRIDQENFILANAARMVYFAGFHKNEIEEIKIKDVRSKGSILSEINPFLKKSRKTYTSMSLFPNRWARTILRHHLSKLESEGYSTDDEAPLFPNQKTKNKYIPKTLVRHFQNYFSDFSFDDLRKMGVEREKRRLEAKYGKSRQICKNELLKYSRHSRLSTTRQFAEGKVQKAGEVKKEDLPWEQVVRKIENLPHIEVWRRKNHANNIYSWINNDIAENDVKNSLHALLNLYKQQLNIN